MILQVPASERLIYARSTPDDIDLMLELDSDPEVMKYINGGIPTTRDDLINIYLPRLAKYTNLEKGWGQWKVCLKGSNEFIGWILIRPMDFFSDNPKYHDIEIGWRFKQNSWGKGYATEAAKAVKAVIAQRPEVTHITAIAEEGNNASINIMKKLGLTYLKTDIHKDPLGDTEVVFYQQQLVT